MEQHFMAEIWAIVAHKENANLSVTEQQNKITEILKGFRVACESFHKQKIKNELISSVQKALNETL